MRIPFPLGLAPRTRPRQSVVTIYTIVDPRARRAVRRGHTADSARSRTRAASTQRLRGLGCGHERTRVDVITRNCADESLERALRRGGVISHLGAREGGSESEGGTGL